MYFFFNLIFCIILSLILYIRILGYETLNSTPYSIHEEFPMQVIEFPNECNLSIWHLHK